MTPPVDLPAAGAERPMSGRLREGMTPLVARSAYRLELQSAGAIMPELALADLAHVLALLDQGLVPAGPGRELLAALLDLRVAAAGRELRGVAGAAPEGDPILLDPALGDLVMNREAWLRGRIGRSAGYLLVGRPRREAVAVAFHLAARARVLALSAALWELQRTLVDLAAAHVETLAVDYTYWQPAQPSTLAHALLGYAYPLGRDADRLRAVFGRVNASPAGAGCTNGTAIPVDRAALAGLLGFDGVVTHARDANWQPDLAFELSAIAAGVGLSLDRLAEDLIVWGTREFAFVELADRAARVSMAMPQKKNPYALVFVRGVAARLAGRLAGAAAIARTATGQPDPRIFAQDEVPESLDLAEQGASLMNEVMAGIRFDRERLGAAARRDYLAGNDLAERIMDRRGLPFGDAHRIVGAAVRLALDDGDSRDGIDAARLDAAAIEVTGSPLALADADVREALDAAAAVERRTGIGGAAPAATRRMIRERRAALRRQRLWLDERVRVIGEAEAALVRRAQEAAAR
jgi:argininosuccinate lyase